MQSQAKNATYSDVRRKWSGLSPHHLEHVAQATMTNNQFADQANSGKVNLLQASGESTTRATEPGSGRTLHDAIAVDDTTPEEQKEEEDTSSSALVAQTSALHPPVLMALDKTGPTVTALGTRDAGEE